MTWPQLISQMWVTLKQRLFSLWCNALSTRPPSYRETILFFPAQGPVNGPEGIQEAPQGNAELADRPRQEEAANGMDLLFLKDIFIEFSVAFDCHNAQQVRWPLPFPNNGIISSFLECRLVINCISCTCKACILLYLSYCRQTMNSVVDCSLG